MNTRPSMSPSLTISGSAPAAGKTGSHLVVRNPEKAVVPRAVVERAAALAAWYSKARAASSVDCPYCKVADRTVVRQLSLLALLEPEPMVERQPSWPPRHYSKRHGRPGYVHWPAVRHSKLDHESHHQEPARSQGATCRT
jgi:hypothetical protein